MRENANRAEAERLLGIAEKLLQSRDLNGTKDFAILAQENEPLLEGPDQILAVAEVLLSAERRVNNHHDWYSILQLDRRSDDHDLIKKQYRRLALLLHPDKNKYAFADQAFKLVADAWAVLSDLGKKSLYDKEIGLFSKVDLTDAGKLTVRRSQRPRMARRDESARDGSDGVFEDGSRSQSSRRRLSSFWTACPYCYVLFEYPRVYENCCLRCQSCERAFHAALIPSLPPLVPGQDAYYCCWAFFPLGFVSSGKGAVAGAETAPFPNWMPPMFVSPERQQQQNGVPGAGSAGGAPGAPPPPRAPPPARMGLGGGDGVARMPVGSGPRKRGRPRKYPLPT